MNDLLIVPSPLEERVKFADEVIQIGTYYSEHIVVCKPVF